MGQPRTFGIIAHWIASKSRAFGHGTFSCVATLRFRQRKPLCGSATLAFATRLLAELRLLETGRELKCINPLRNRFDSIAVIAPVFAPISRSRKSFSCRCPVLQRKPEPCPHIHPRLGGTRVRRRDRDCRHPPHGFVRRCGRAHALQTIVRIGGSTRRESGTLRVLIVPTRSVWG
jgi:hypothetical protein